MSYIGNPVVNAAFVTDNFSGTGSQTVYTMTIAPANTASIFVIISGVTQDPSTYSVNGLTLTFSQAPPAGSNNISVRYLGVPANEIATTAYRTVTDFTATASQTTFSVPSYTAGYIDVYRNGARLGAADYTATNGTTVVLANAATVGDLVTTESFYVSSVLNAIPAIAGQVGPAYLASGAATQGFLDVGNFDGTGALLTPSGNTAQRPSSPTVGMQRWNTTIGGMEIYIGTGATGWQTIASTAYTVDYLVVGGGGGGGHDVGGGGGAGGYISGTGLSLTPGTTYSITVGSGGAGSATSGTGSAGSSSSFSTFSTALGGGGGGSWQGTAGAAGGSGGGGAGAVSSAGAGGAGTVGQGNNGGAGNAGGYTSGNGRGGGGGGAGTAGSSGSSTANGGAGLQWFNGNYYAGGGGGNTDDGSNPGAGGTGGGGGGASTGVAGTANTGGGGSGTGTGSAGGGAGGSGIVIIRYLGSAARATGGTVTIANGYVTHTFNSSGTYVA